MAFTENGGAKIYWDEQGIGTPILLIRRLTYPAYMGHCTGPLLAAQYRTTAFDRACNRSQAERAL